MYPFSVLWRFISAWWGISRPAFHQKLRINHRYRDGAKCGEGAREALTPPPTFLLSKQHFLCYFIKTKLQETLEMETLETLRLSNTMLRTHARLFNNVKQNLFTCCFSVLFKVKKSWFYKATWFEKSKDFNLKNKWTQS